MAHHRRRDRPPKNVAAVANVAAAEKVAAVALLALATLLLLAVGPASPAVAGPPTAPAGQGKGKPVLGPVQNLEATTAQAPDLQTIDLHWDTPDPDRLMDYYTVYGSPTPDFTPQSATLVVRAPVSRYAHSGLGPGTWHYRVVAVDAAGNVGRFRDAVQVSATAAEPLPQVPREHLTVTATSQHVGYEAGKAIDGLTSTMWHSEYSLPEPLPQALVVDIGSVQTVRALTSMPRQDGNGNGVIRDYTVSTSVDGVDFTTVAEGTWEGGRATRHAIWSALPARYVRLEARSGGGGYASVAELQIFGPSSAAVGVLGAER